jgi:hypothetical protein
LPEKNRATIVAPLRRGERRLVQITNAQPFFWSDGKYGANSEIGPADVRAAYIVSIAWIDTPGPVVTVDEQRDAPN